MGGLKNRDKLVSEICGLVHPCCDDSLMRCSLSSCHYTALPTAPPNNLRYKDITLKNNFSIYKIITNSCHFEMTHNL